ncbi:MAG: DUF4147 domain-containing protein [Candidatus Eiseniibacteriota bacterium]|nr:MAG: DUF4147 domain-containing protein [Candidatus Eisenbacteria bacterium]
MVTIIKNRHEISTTELRRQVLDMVEAGISSVFPLTLVKSAVRYDCTSRVLSIFDREYDLSRGRLFVVGGGKATGRMAEVLESVLGTDTVTAGIVNCARGEYDTLTIRTVEAGHPTPDERGQEGVRQMLSMKHEHSIGPTDLVICLISGGGSAMMPFPAEGVTLADKRETTRLLLGSGADIREMNVVRKHLSRVKGGWFGRYFAPSRVVSLIISDVVGNDLESIASGPTVPDSSTFSDAYALLDKYGLVSRVPSAVTGFLTRGREGKEEETPKTLGNCSNHIIGDNMLALQAAAAAARELGLKPYIVTAEQTGDTATVAEQRAKEIIAGRYSGQDVILVGGETTPTLPENAGKGGRNQHYAASSILAMEKQRGEWAMASVGTDGLDFGHDVAGAIVDDKSLATARAKQLHIRSYLDSYDSNTFLAGLGGSLIVTGNTGTNVSDIMVYALKQE